MSFFLFPDKYLDSIFDINIDELLKMGIKNIITDIDNTLEPYEVSTPSEKVYNWLKNVESKGIKIAFVSNNEKGRVYEFNKELGYQYIYKAGKPLTKKVKILMKNLDASNNNTMMLGDQIFTDIWCGKNLGLYSILVKPIKDKKTLFFRFKRLLEKPIIFFYRRGEKHGR